MIHALDHNNNSMEHLNNDESHLHAYVRSQQLRSIIVWLLLLPSFSPQFLSIITSLSLARLCVLCEANQCHDASRLILISAIKLRICAIKTTFASFGNAGGESEIPPPKNVRLRHSRK